MTHAWSSERLQLPARDTGSVTLGFIEELIASSIRVATDPVLTGLQIPRPSGASRRRYAADLLTAFEIARASSADAARVAGEISAIQQERCTIAIDGVTLPLSEAMTGDARPLTLETSQSVVVRPARDCWPRGTAPDIPLNAILDPQSRPAWVDDDTAKALAWSAAQSAPDLLRGQKFALLGGTAELSPLSHLLAGGATVFTTHTGAAAPAMAAPALDRGGVLHVVPGGVDLLECPAALAEAMLTFAGGDRIHLAMLAYRGGQSQEWRLAIAMDAVARRLRAAGALASLTVYQSPSVPTEVSSAVAARSRSNLAAQSSTWRRAVQAVSAGWLFRPNVVSAGPRHWSRPAVPEQGMSYLAANLFGKRYAAEALSAPRAGDGGPAIRVSANVAPIAFTCSTATPAGRLVLPELESLGITAFNAPTARYLMYLLMLRDLFGPPVAGGADSGHALPSAHLDGGVFAHPWALDSILHLAYTKGRARSLGLLRGRFPA